MVKRMSEIENYFKLKPNSIQQFLYENDIDSDEIVEYCLHYYDDDLEVTDSFATDVQSDLPVSVPILFEDSNPLEDQEFEEEEEKEIEIPDQVLNLILDYCHEYTTRINFVRSISIAHILYELLAETSTNGPDSIIAAVVIWIEDSISYLNAMDNDPPEESFEQELLNLRNKQHHFPDALRNFRDINLATFEFFPKTRPLMSKDEQDQLFESTARIIRAMHFTQLSETEQTQFKTHALARLQRTQSNFAEVDENLRTTYIKLTPSLFASMMFERAADSDELNLEVKSYEKELTENINEDITQVHVNAVLAGLCDDKPLKLKIRQWPKLEDQMED